MKKLLFILLMLFCSKVNAQLGNLFFGENGDDFIYEMVSSPDGNFYLVGSKTILIPQIWLMKVTPSGEVLWEKTYTPDNDAIGEYGYAVNVFPDGSLILTGEKRRDVTFRKESGLAIKTNEHGEQIWRRGYANISTIFDAAPSGDGILFGGWYDNTGSSDSGILLFADNTGQQVSRLEVDIHNQNFIKKLIPLEDGNLLLLGRSNVIGVGFGGIFMRKIKPDGEAIWTATNDTDFDGYLYLPLGAFISADGEITVVNPTGYSSDIKVMQYTANGALIYEKFYGDPNISEIPVAVIPLENEGMLIAGDVLGTASFALQLNKDGFEEWLEYFNSPDAGLEVYDAEETQGKFLLGGRYQHNITGTSNYDGWLLAIEKNGNQYPYTIKGQVILDENFNCLADPGEPLLSEWFADVSGQHRFDTLMTDLNGTFFFRADEGSYQFTLYNRDTSMWRICYNPFNIDVSDNNPIDSVVFLAQSLDLCPKLRVDLTQPALVRCDTACFTASILNDGVVSSLEQVLRVGMDKELSLVSVSEPYTNVGSDLIFTIDPLERWKGKNIDFCVVLDCNVQLGATHTIKASIADACLPSYQGPRYVVKAECDGDMIRFRMYNSGGGGNSAITHFSIFADGLIIEENIQVTLPEGGTETILTFPADGRTWRIKVEQDPGAPGYDHPTEVIEGCGKQNNGLHSVAFKNAFHSNDLGPAISILQIENTLSESNKVEESTKGLGYFNFLNEIRPLEYTARFRNHNDQSVSEVSIDLIISPTFDPRSFRLFYAPGNSELSYPQHNTIRVKCNDLVLLPGQDFMVRFSIKPRDGIIPDAGPQSLFIVEAKAYLNKEGPFDLFTAFNNYSLTAPVNVDEYNIYPEEIKLFGGRNYEFGNCMGIGMDESIFVAGTSNSYDTRFRTDGFVVKTNRDGEAQWLTTFDDGSNGYNSVQGICGLGDGGCIAASVLVPEGLDNTIGNARINMVRLDRNGHVVWRKIINPTTPAWIRGMVETADSNFLVYGSTRNTGGDQFYLKLDEDGNIIWSKFIEISGSNFDPTHGIALRDGSFAFVGTNNSTIIDVDVFVEKISSSGEVIWNTEYESQNYIYLGGIAEGENQELMIAGDSQWALNDTDYVATPTFIKLDEDGDFIWERSPIIGPFNIARANYIIPAKGGYLAGGEIFTDTVSQLNDMLLMKITDEAEVVWYQNYGAKNDEWANTIITLSEDEIFLWGHNQRRPPYYNLQSMLVKVDGQGQLVHVNRDDIPYTTVGNTFIFPNPVNDVLHCILSPQPSQKVHWVIVDIMGRIIMSGYNAPESNISIEIDQLASGSYFIIFPNTIYPAGKFLITE